MRMKASESGIRVPPFVHVLNYGRVRAFLDQVRPPWVLKPRSMAGAIGIKKVHSADELWPIIDGLGDMQSYYLLEQFVPGDIFHVDTIVYELEILFTMASGYGRPPMEVSHHGGVFTTRTLERDSEDARRLLAANETVMRAFGMVRGVSHTEFIKARDGGEIYFLETSARVGGAHIVELLEAATGLNLWAEWAKLEIAGGKSPYRPPEPAQDYSGLLVSLARQERPDTSAYTDPEIVWRMDRPNHVGLIVKSPSAGRVRELLEDYVERVQRDFQAYMAPREKPTS
jgi:biotin carboxylase